MSANKSETSEKTVSYLIRGIPGAAWRNLKIRAIREQKKLREALLEIIEQYGEGEAVEPHGKARKK